MAAVSHNNNDTDNSPNNDDDEDDDENDERVARLVVAGLMMFECVLAILLEVGCGQCTM
jgi:hypothetical protein